MTYGKENRQRNCNREGEESECMSVFSVCLYAHVVDGGDQGRRVTSVKSDGRESTCNVASPEARKAAFIAHRLLEKPTIQNPCALRKNNLSFTSITTPTSLVALQQNTYQKRIYPLVPKDSLFTRSTRNAHLLWSFQQATIHS